MSQAASATLACASRAIAGSATTIMVEFSGTSALPSAIEPMSRSDERVTCDGVASASRGGVELANRAAVPVDLHQFAVVQRRERDIAADNGRDAEFARDDRGVRERSAHVGD